MNIQRRYLHHLRYIFGFAVVVLFTTVTAPAGLYRMPLSSDTAVHYYFDEDSSGNVLDWNCGLNTYNGHRGTDFSGGPRGRAILAGADGTIYYTIDGYGDGYAGSTDGGGFGNHVRLVHSDNYVTIYGHLNVNSVTTKPIGSGVLCGEQIGGVGTSGNSTGLHLHFEVRPCTNCVSVDPFSGPCSTPVSRWVAQPGGHPTNVCENGFSGPPTAPDQLTATSASSTQVNLSWADNAINESGFKIEQALLPGGPWTQIATANSNVTSFANSGLASSSTYFYRVRCTNGLGDSAFSNVATADTSNSPPVVDVINNQMVVGGTTLNFPVTATDGGLGLTKVIATFETNAPGTQYVMFRDPLYSGSTSAYISGPENSLVSATFPTGNASTRALNVYWGFSSSANAWLRLTTASAPVLPNPTVSFSQILRFDIYTDRSLKVGLGLRETSTTAEIGANGGGSGSVEWVGVTNASGGTPAPTRIIPATNWTSLSFNIPAEPVTTFTGNGVLTSTTGKGTLEELAIVPNAGSGAYNVYLDNFTSTLTNRLLYSLAAGAPAGATINSNSGVFNWTTPVVSVNTTNTITVRVTDNGSPATNATRTFQVIITPQPTTPPAPTANAATSVSSTSFTANWSSSAGATGYRLDVSTSSGFVSYVSGYQNLDVGNVLSRGVTNLSANTTYYYRLRAYNTSGTSGNSGSITVITAPPAPTANAATSVTSSNFTANWSTATGATGYRLDVSTNSGFGSYVSGYQNLDVGNVLTRAVAGLSASTTYFYRVRAYHTGGTSGNSGNITVTTTAGPPPVPTATDATGETTSAFTANWNTSTGATGYRLDVSTNSGFSSYVTGYQNLDVGNVLSRNVTGLAVGTTHYYRVRAYSGGGTSANSATITAVTVPVAPTATAATSVGSTGFTANWSAVVGATGYRLDVSTNSGFSNYVSGYQDLDVGNVLSNTVSGLTPNTTNYYRVRAHNAGGSSANSGTITTVTSNATCTVNALANASFESGNTGGVGNGWTGYQRAPAPTTVWTIQTASPPSGGGTQYQQIANTSSTGGGGVRQNVTGCTIGATYTIAGWMRGNSGLYSTCTVKVSPSASTNWASAINLAPAQTYTGSTWTAFSGTVVATGTSMTLWLDGQTSGTGQNKAECFDMVSVTCTGGQGAVPPQPLRVTSVSVPAPNQVRLVVSGVAGSSVTIQRSTDLADWQSLTNLNNETGTVEFTETTSPEAPRYFYRATSP